MEALRKHWSTLGRQLNDMLVAFQSRVDRVTIDISTDASVDVSVEVRYKIHDPKNIAVVEGPINFCRLQFAKEV